MTRARAGDWEKTMRTLADTDCRGLGDRLIEQMEGMSAVTNGPIIYFTFPFLLLYAPRDS